MTDDVANLVIAVTDAAVPAAQEHQLEIHTRRIVGLMIFARGLIMRVEALGSYHATTSCNFWLTGLFASDANCGDAYDAAVDDTAFGVVNGCGRTNPSNVASAPRTKPVCS